MTTSEHVVSDALIGCDVDLIDTPALVIDLDVMERNLHKMSEYARAHDVRLRPHAKMHKCGAIVRLQMDAGAVGVCVQKTSEAEALIMANDQLNDVFISNEVVSPYKLARVARIAKTLNERGGRLAIAVDSLIGVQNLATAMAALNDSSTRIDVFIEIDVGHGRCGVDPRKHVVTQLARAIEKETRLHFKGLQAYQGNAQHVRTVEERRALIQRATNDITAAVAQLQAANIGVELVTGAGTGTFIFEATSGVYGELQAGSYLLMDADYADNEMTSELKFEHALFVKSQVVSVGADHAVCDAGHKSHAVDSGMPRVHRAEASSSLPDDALTFDNGGDEHGILRGTTLPEIGATVWLIPGHCDPTINLHDKIVCVRGGLTSGKVEQIFRVDARGCLT